MEQLIENNDIETILSLNPKELDDRDEELNSPLHIAASVGNLKIVQILYSKGQSLYARNCRGFCPIHSAAEYGHVDIIQWFLSIDPELIFQRAEYPFNATPLDIARKESQTKVVDFFNNYKM